MKHFPSFTSLLLLFASCTAEIDQQFNDGRIFGTDNVVFYATVETPEDSDTKVYADEQMRVLWNAGDRISIFNKTTYNQPYRFKGDDGDNAGGFSKVPTDDEFATGMSLDHIFAVYPFVETTKVNNDGNIILSLPGVQAYKENSFGIGANTLVSATQNTMLQFKSLGGFLSFKFYGDGVSVKRVSLRGNNGEPLAGKATVAMSVGGTPSVIDMDASATGTITLDCETPVSLSSSAANYTEFWFVVPPVTFSNGFTVTVTDALDGTFEKSTSNAVTIERNKLKRMAPMQVVPDYSGGNIPFEDANFKAYCVANFDSDDDGEISFLEAEGIESINVNTDNISSVKEIEFMPNLKQLSIRGSWDSSSQKSIGALSALDVSNNTALTYLNCEHNQLTSLNLSKNTALTYLNCEFNQLISLDVSNNTTLTYLDCWSNQLMSLDVSNNSALQSLGCEANQLSSLDVSNNSALTSLGCGANQLTNLDVSSILALTELYCSGNQLTSLDVSKNTALTVLWCFANPYLNEIWLKTGQVFNTFSYDEDVANIYYVDGAISFEDTNFKAYCVANFDSDHDGEISYLEAKEIEGININTDNISSVKGIEFMPNLVQLSIRGSWDSDLVQYKGLLSSMDVSKNIALQALDCSGNQLSSLDISKNTALTMLRCNDNQLTRLDVSNNKDITELYCYNNLLTSLDVSNNTALLTLSCSSNPLTSLNVSKTVALQHLDCTFNQLTSLDVSYNLLLTTLDCGYNELTSLSISNNTALTYLGCYSNQLTRLDISNNTALQNLLCYSNQLTRLDVSKNIALQELDCSNNLLTSLDVSKNTALTQLYCYYNQLTSLDVSKNAALKVLICFGNQYLIEIWLKTGQTISRFEYDTTIATVKYKD